MKHLLYIGALFISSYCRADVPPSVIKRFNLVIKLIKEEKVTELSALIDYPLKRQNPLPDIADAKAFIANANILLDDAFRKKVSQYNDSDIFEHHGVYGLVGGVFDGDIWIGENGKITAFNYSYLRETELRNKLTKQIQKQVYPSVNSWEYNVLVCKSEKLLIRIDKTTKGFRYVSWSKGHPMSEKPDLILFNGVEEAQGTQGGWTWTFVNGDWTYVIDYTEMCEDAKDCGLFLQLLFKGNEKSSTRLKEIK